MKQTPLRFVLLFLLLSGAALGQASPHFSNLVVFGDSLSDDGNIAHDVGLKFGVRYPSELFNYTDGRFTDGTATNPAAHQYFGVWVEQLATSLGLPVPTASATGGTDYAYGDATTQDGVTNVVELGYSLPIRNMGQQVTDYLTLHPQADPAALFVVWGGGNDFFANPNPLNIPVVAARVAALVDRLARAGAVNILVPNLPPLGSLPTYSGQATLIAALNAGSAAYQIALTADLNTLQSSFSSSNLPVNLYRLDVYDLFLDVARNSAAYGITDFTHAAQGNASANPDQYLFWDVVHPTTGGHHQIAQGALNVLAAGPDLPQISGAAGVVNGASLAGTIASGAWVTIFGQNLAATTRVWSGTDFVNGKLPPSLDGVSVTIDGKPAYVYYISPTQLNVLAPVDDTTGPVNVKVTTASGRSTSVTVNKTATSPAFFQFDPQNRKYIAAEFVDYTLVGPAGLFGTAVATRPAKPGEIVSLFATGLGATSPDYPDGQLFTTNYPLKVSPTVTIGGQPATVYYSGLVGPGLYQVNVAIPALPDGDSSVVIDLGGSVVSAAATSYLAIQN